MPFKLVLSPLAKRQLQRLWKRFPYPALKQAVRAKGKAYAANPSKERHPDIDGHPSFLVVHKEGAQYIYILFFCRFLIDEERIEILGLETLGLDDSDAPLM